MADKKERKSIKIDSDKNVTNDITSIITIRKTYKEHTLKLLQQKLKLEKIKLLNSSVSKEIFDKFLGDPESQNSKEKVYKIDVNINDEVNSNTEEINNKISKLMGELNNIVNIVNMREGIKVGRFYEESRI